MSNYGNWHGVDGLHGSEYVRARGENVNGEDVVELEIGDFESLTLLYLSAHARQSLIAAVAAAGVEATQTRDYERNAGFPRTI